jgi:tRNA threonylcarbamoyladenosine biosynthesis protein TsaE
MIVETNSPRETYDLGVSLGKGAEPGQVFGLVGELGVGTTIFTQGLGKGLGIDEIINSPSFMIVQEYHSGTTVFNHFDVYRIGDIEELEEIGFDEYLFGGGVTLVEWSDLITPKMPPKYTKVEIIKDVSKGFDYRKITIKDIDDESVGNR